MVPFSSSTFPSLSVGLGHVCALYLAPQPYLPATAFARRQRRVVGPVDEPSCPS